MLGFFVEKVTFWDACVSIAVFKKHGHRQTLYRFLRLVSRSADGHLYPVLALLLCIMMPDRTQLFGLCILIAFGIELPISQIIKKTIRRERPCTQIAQIHNLVAFPDHFSFPSGHTAAAFVMACVSGHFFPSVAYPALVWSFLVGFSRLYLGVHYLTDILVGAVIGAFGSLTAIYITNILC